MAHTVRHGEIPAVLHRKAIKQGSSLVIALTQFLDNAEYVTIYVLKNGKRHLLIEIDKFPDGKIED